MLRRQLWQIDEKDNLLVHVDVDPFRWRVEGDVGSAVHDRDLGPDSLQQIEDVGREVFMGVLQHQVARYGADVSNVGVGDLG